MVIDIIGRMMNIIKAIMGTSRTEIIISNLIEIKDIKITKIGVTIMVRDSMIDSIIIEIIIREMGIIIISEIKNQGVIKIETIINTVIGRITKVVGIGIQGMMKFNSIEIQQIMMSSLIIDVMKHNLIENQ